MARPTRAGSNGERGFTLAALIVILSIMMIFVAYTVPKQWSSIMQREREKQTIFEMHEFARAVWEYQNKNHSYPTSVDQLLKARLPRMIRGKDLPVDPLTGQVDWLVVPMTSAMQGRPNAPGTAPGTGVGLGPSTTPGGPATTVTAPPTTTDTTGTSSGDASSDKSTTSGSSIGNQPGSQQIQAFPIKDYAGGPFVGIRSPKTGKSFLMLNGMDMYEQWNYTALDYDAEVKARQLANATIYR